MWTTIAALATAAPLPSDEISIPPYTLRGGALCLASGLEIHAVAREGASVVSVTTVIEGGRAGEAPQARGAAHLLEHLWFESTPGGGAPVAERLSTLPYQGETLTDATVYTTVVAPEDLTAILKLEAARLVDPLAGVSEATFARERRVMHLELVWRGADARDPVRQELEAAWFPSDGPWIGQRRGTLAQADALTMADVRAYAARWYRPEHATIRIEGAIDLKQMDAVVAQALPPSVTQGTREVCDRPPQGLVPPDPVTTALRTVDAPVEHPSLAFGWTVPAGYGPEDSIGTSAARYLDDFLRRELASVRKMKEEDVDLRCVYTRGRIVSLLWCNTRLSEGVDPERALREVAESTKDVWVGWSPEVLERGDMGSVNSAMDAGARFDHDSLTARALASHYAPGGIDPFWEANQAVPKRFSAVVDYAQRWLVADRMAAVAVRPVAPPVEPSGGTAAAFAPPAPVGWHAPPAPSGSWQPERLKNGLQVWTWAAPGTRLAHTALVLPGGKGSGPIGAGDADDLLTISREGLGGSMARAVAAQARLDAGVVSWALSARGPAGNLDAQLSSMNGWIFESEYYGRTSDWDTPLMRSALERLAERPELFVDVAHGRHLFPGARAGMTFWEGWRAARDISRAGAAQWRAASLQPTRATLLVAGEVDPASAAALARTYLGKWKASGAEPPATGEAPPLPTAAQVRAVEANSTVLGTASFACRVPARTAANDAALDLTEWLVHKTIASTFRAGAGAYDVSAWVTEFGPIGGELRVEASVPPAEAARALQSFGEVTGRLAEGPDESWLAWGRQGVRLERAARLSSAAGALEIAKAAVEQGLSVSDLAGYDARLDQVDAAAVRDVLAGCVGRESQVYVGPRIEIPGATWVDWAAEVDGFVRSW